ncbi:CBS domain-containing protein [Paenibacillus hodogayensis]|uniref:CBS domain-containing protein n=1 Tax=Paenibacillus hodogayensis TaxID=279208 RepID=A0ABV5W3C2_9BACL
MNTKVISVSTATDRMEVLEIIKKYSLLAVPVLTPDDKLVGIVTFDDVLAAGFDS